MIRLVLLLLSAVAAAISTVTHWWILPIAVVIYAATVILAMRQRTVRRGGDSDQTGAAIVLSVATGIVVLHAGADTVAVWEVAALLAILHAVHLARHVVRVLVFRRWRGATDWRNVTVAAPVPRRVLPVAGATLAPIPAWILAPVFAIYDVADILYLMLGILCILLMLATLVPTSIAVLANLRMPPDEVRLKALTAALRDLDPEILVHFNARVSSAYAITDWMAVLEKLAEQHRVVILTVDREPWHFDTIGLTTIPLVHLNGAEAIEYFVEQVPSLVLALYPRNTSPNKNLLRVPRLYDVFLGHGESDKAETANPATRAFDEVWVAGEAAHDRFMSAGIGIRSEQLRITGRPQLAGLLELAKTPRSGAPKSVVYAPTWSGYFAEDGYGSLELMGEQIVDTLLERDDIRVTYLPHPALGTLNQRIAEVSERIVSKLRRAGGSVVIAGSLEDRQSVLADADLLLADIGNDVVDFLVLDRPYIVLNPHDQSTTKAFEAANPSSSAGDLVDLDGLARLGDIVGRALATDSRSAERVALARRYLGDVSAPVERFLAEVSACLQHVHATVPVRVLPEEPVESDAEKIG